MQNRTALSDAMPVLHTTLQKSSAPKAATLKFEQARFARIRFIAILAAKIEFHFTRLYHDATTKMLFTYI